MSTLRNLKQAASLRDVAIVLGYRPSALSFLLYKLPSADKYTTFSIPKKSGGVREINAPTPKIKALQRRLADTLTECEAEISKKYNFSRSLSHGFRKGHSILTNARPHKGRRFVLNVDIKDFFPSFNFGRIRGFFIKNSDFNLHPSVATILAQIACYNDRLPQGSPCSPIISELLTHFLDVRLTRFAKHYKCTYSRYADDLTFSTSQKTFPTALATAKTGAWSLGGDLQDRIEAGGFSANVDKTRMQCRGSRQTVTGLTVNRKVNVQADYYRLARTMAFTLFKDGKYHCGDGDLTDSIAQIEGILNHIFYVREREPETQIEKIETDQQAKERNDAKYKTPSSIRKIYRQALFYKHFIALDKPLLLCEGNSDIVYLKAAVRNLKALYPKLATVAAGKTNLNVRFFKYGHQSRDVLQLGGGGGDIKNFLAAYSKQAAPFQHVTTNNPVIIFLDNDSGTFSTFKVVENTFHITANLKTDLPFYHLSKNLYLVKTPTLGASGSSYIENFFKPTLLNTSLDGKKFNHSDDYNPATEYGKIEFADRIVAPNYKTIDFSDFSPLLGRIVAVMDHFAAAKTSASVAR